jgi:HEAT repeat protein
MPSPPKWGTTPRRSVAEQCERIGTPAVVAGCVALLEGRRADPKLILALGGRPARWAAGYDEPAGPAYWLRVWGARGLVWAWDDKAANAVIRALSDESWRVREMAARVVGRHRLRQARPALERLRRDENARVRHAAERALEKLE